jgi:site-specific DNA-cytosine methylase
MKVLSLFDGMSCGQIALERAGITVDEYYSCEIKPHAIKVTQDNYPNTIQLGDITKIGIFEDRDGVWWIENKETGQKFDIEKIDLVIGGSPCQDFSQANKVRKGLEGEKSGLFYEFVRLLDETEAEYFLLENVKMKKEWESVISEELGVEPININSKLISAGMRNRLYWTNIPNVTVPAKIDVSMSDILTSGYTPKEKAYCLLESESRPQKTNWKRFRRWRKKGFVNIVFETPDLNLFKNRILNQTELERLQTVPEGYTKLLNRNDAACLLGDGWTVDVIAHIFKNIKE